MQPLNALTDTDLERLDDFLASDDMPESAMDVATLEGWLTALAIGPRLVMPSAWLPWVWDFEDGREEAVFADSTQANEMLAIIMGLSNRIAETFRRNPRAFEPVFYRRAEWGAAEWCEGFLKATLTFDADAWSALWTMDAFQDPGNTNRSGLITPFLRLGDAEGLEITKKEGDARRWVDAIVPSLLAIDAHWAQQRAEPAAAQAPAPMRRATPKVGRNDACPCGSGRKFKKCCGQSPTLH
ncbi:UPF0149 family protein [Solimonas terrae]|uniref:UPF0149 family protein n=1 Tax=Solimonas terrae TaxID=1396819 RepID=A0A6M2BP73_9GAMM|nr:UPF0149 family protein [Solimonas terrae]NGY03869.1 UPF0149 family protein [Solimonas terrae]